MIYRMKQNAVGLSNICILSTCVLVMISTTVSLYIGMEDVLRTRYPRNIAVKVENASKDMEEKLDSMIIEEAEKHNITMRDAIKYRSIEVPVVQRANDFSIMEEGTLNNSDISSFGVLSVIPLDVYNNQENASVNLEEDEILLYTIRGEIKEATVSILGNDFKIKENLENFTVEGIFSNGY